jgi:hypothetical protein
MFIERLVGYSALFTYLVGWHASAVSWPSSDIILAQLACPLNDVMFCLHSRITNLSLYKHWLNVDKIFLWCFEIGIKMSLLLNIVLEKISFPMGDENGSTSFGRKPFGRQNCNPIIWS